MNFAVRSFIFSITLRVMINAPLICIALRAITFSGLRLWTSRGLFTRHALPLCGSAWVGSIDVKSVQLIC